MGNTQNGAQVTYRIPGMVPVVSIISQQSYRGRTHSLCPKPQPKGSLISTPTDALSYLHLPIRPAHEGPPCSHYIPALGSQAGEGRAEEPRIQLPVEPWPLPLRKADKRLPLYEDVNPWREATTQSPTSRKAGRSLRE